MAVVPMGCTWQVGRITKAATASGPNMDAARMDARILLDHAKKGAHVFRVGLVAVQTVKPSPRAAITWDVDVTAAALGAVKMG